MCSWFYLHLSVPPSMNPKYPNKSICSSLNWTNSRMFVFSHMRSKARREEDISLCYHASGSNIWKKTVEDCCQHEGLWPYDNFLDGIYKVIQNMTYEVVRRQYTVYNITKWNQKHQIEHQITVCWLADDVNVSHDISSIVSLFK